MKFKENRKLKNKFYMQNQNPFILFMQELFQRFRTKSPKFFRIFQWVLSALTAVSGIPPLLVTLHVTLPPEVNQPFMKFVAFAAGGALFMSMLPIQNKIVGVDEAGAPLLKTNEEKLPFTAKHEAQKVEDKPVPVLTPDPTNPVADRNN
jgi:hypothetical protein